jgi:hypothetical protein
VKAWLTATWTRRREFILFLLAGGINTALTYGLYLLLLLVMSYPFAYTGSYVAGIFLSYYLNARFVFREPLSLAKALKYPNKKIAPLVIVVVTVPATFVMSRYIIRGRKKDA